MNYLDSITTLRQILSNLETAYYFSPEKSTSVENFNSAKEILDVILSTAIELSQPISTQVVPKK